MENTFISHRLLDAIELAIRAHAKTSRKGDDKPYLIHPIAVFGLLTKWESNEDIRIAGLLHDVIEEAGDDSQRAKHRGEIEQNFGRGVLEIVEEVTEQDKSLPWRIRKEHALERLQSASEASLLVCCADHTHNTFSLLQGYWQQGEPFWQRFNAPKELKLWYIDETLRVLTKRLALKYVSDLQKLANDLHTSTGGSI